MRGHQLSWAAWPTASRANSALLGPQPDQRPPPTDRLRFALRVLRTPNRPICHGLTFARQDGSSFFSSFPSFFFFSLFPPSPLFLGCLRGFFPLFAPLLSSLHPPSPPPR
ncbi:uncharacterized protein BO80DRAFT_233196 [Aspergillus ibericus CBS 121593]|uniref:Uncharacterized protein n=1 Tax=Aspergillus ibericus CBS 121593 TaxID=1448316 RepID=A0A395H8U2_9EURO|nr:hypothetical protein BO80DRAFT_233196 [Aspergillus ibericus CBS 121593]RAL04327.1 hypothetical protein BO80DRAFT_233196 [Aspergillus ibericus CBS 121593]